MNPINEAYQKVTQLERIDEAKQVDAYQHLQTLMYDMWNTVRSLQGQIRDLAYKEIDKVKKEEMRDAADMLSGTHTYILGKLQSRDMRSVTGLKGIKVKVK